jgi:hypothetical protein
MNRMNRTAWTCTTRSCYNYWIERFIWHQPRIPSASSTSALAREYAIDAADEYPSAEVLGTDPRCVLLFQGLLKQYILKEWWIVRFSQDGSHRTVSSKPMMLSWIGLLKKCVYTHPTELGFTENSHRMTSYTAEIRLKPLAIDQN